MLHVNPYMEEMLYTHRTTSESIITVALVALIFFILNLFKTSHKLFSASFPKIVEPHVRLPKVDHSRGFFFVYNENVR